MTNQLTPFRLAPTDLKRTTSPSTLPKNSKHRLPINPAFGQTRAIKAITTALDIHANGYHVFAIGEHGLGKRTIITRLLAKRAKTEPTPPDLVYVHHFAKPRCPIAISLPAGQGMSFAKDMHRIWHSLYKKILAKFSTISYQNQLSHIKQHAQKTGRTLLDELDQTARSHNLTLSQIADQRANFVVLDDSLPVDGEMLHKLQKQLNKINIQLDDLEENINEQIDQLHQTMLEKIITPLFEPIRKKYPNERIKAYLDDYQHDVIDNVIFILENDEDFMSNSVGNTPNRYHVNVLVSHKPNSGSPVVFADMPTHPSLLGHIEYNTQLGTILTDASMIRAGALHKANGGYLIIDGLALLEHPYAWQGLKKALSNKQLTLSSLEQMLTMTGSVSLEPDGVALSVKVILLGDLALYDELLAFDPDFAHIFKIRADFHHHIKRTTDNELALVAKMSDMIKAHDLPAFDNHALAQILTQLSVWADHKHRLDLHANRLLGLLVESARLAKQQNSPTVHASHVIQAIKDKQERTNHLSELYQEDITSGQQLIDTSGQKIGQINALTIIAHADSEFGLPARLTALVTPKFGTGEIIDIEREVELGGEIHAKGVMIMTNFLRSLFSEYCELNFTASLAFEQSYAHIDGDSATLAECAVLLSALANVPIDQSIAITGSMNQLGEAQAIGGVNEKITGFFEICQTRGLVGQGVIIPRTNLDNLMLNDDIITAVANGQFHIYAVETIYDALLILTNLPIHDKNKKGDYKKNTLFAKIIERLLKWQDDGKK